MAKRSHRKASNGSGVFLRLLNGIVSIARKALPKLRKK